jgi:hypothetical protein
MKARSILCLKKLCISLFMRITTNNSRPFWDAHHLSFIYKTFRLNWDKAVFCRTECCLYDTFFLVVKGPAADATDAPQPWGLLCNPMMKMTITFCPFPSNGAPMEWNWQGKAEVLGEKPLPVPLCPPQIPHGLTPGPNPGLRGGRPAANSLSNGTAYTIPLIRFWWKNTGPDTYGHQKCYWILTKQMGPNLYEHSLCGLLMDQVRYRRNRNKTLNDTRTVSARYSREVVLTCKIHKQRFSNGTILRVL